MKKEVTRIVLFFTIAVFLSASVWADTITKPHTFANGTTADADEVNENFDEVYDQVNKIGGAITVNSDNVGINTTNPIGPLHIKDNGDKAYCITIERSGPGSPRLNLVNTSLGSVSTAPNWAIDNDGDNFRIFREPSIGTRGTTFLNITNSGDVGIGTNAPSYRLHVNGTIGTTNSGQVHSDYVFEPDYNLMSLDNLEDFVKKEKHLPGIITDPKKAPNVDILSLNGKLLAKIEELTLYIIEQNKKISALEEKVKNIDNKSK